MTTLKLMMKKLSKQPGLSIQLSPNSHVVLKKTQIAKKLIRRAIRKGFHKAGETLVRTAKKEVRSGTKSGRTYTVYVNGRRRRHRASAPGQSHARMTGKLDRSIQFKVHGERGVTFGYGVAKGNEPAYGVFLEAGTGKMKPRPTLNNAVKASIRDIENYFNITFADEFGV